MWLYVFMSNLLSSLLCCCIETCSLIGLVQLWEWGTCESSQETSQVSNLFQQAQPLEIISSMAALWKLCYAEVISQPFMLRTWSIIFFIVVYWVREKVQQGKKEYVPLCSTTHITQSLMKPKLWMAVDLQTCMFLKDTYSPVEQYCSAHMSLDSPLHSVQQLGLPDASHGWSRRAPKKTVLKRNAFCL